MASTKRRTQVGSDQASSEIRRLWGDVPVCDATDELRIFIAPCDYEGARPKDPGGCVFARALQRTCGSTKVLIFRSVAYADLPDTKGTRKVERFELGPGMRDLIESFDQNKSTIPEAGFVLKPPVKSKSFAARLKRNQKSRLRRKLLGERQEVDAVSPNRGKKYQDAPLLIDLAVRSGRGAVHFTKKRGSEKKGKK